MKYIKLISLIGLFSLLITSCSKKSKTGKMIPKDAAVIIDINTKSLLSKLSWDEIKKTYWYNELMSDSSIPAASKAFIDEPAKTGIDLTSDIIFFVLKPDNNGQAVVEGSLKDSKAFADLFKNMHSNATITKDGELNIFKSDKAVIGWNDEKFAIVSNTGTPKFQEGMLSDSIQQTVPLVLPSSDSLVSICKNLFALNDDNSLYKNERFAALEKEEGDVHFWVNITELSKSSMKGMPEMMGMVKLDKFLENNISTATINFQDGKVTATNKQYFGKELSDILKKGDGNINTDMIKRLPSQNIAGIYSLHFTPGNLLEIVKLTGLDGFINLFMAQAGLSLEDVVKATKGDILFAVSDIAIKNDTINLMGMKDTIRNYSQKADATFLFAVAIGDKDAFNKLMNLGKTMGKDMTEKNTFSKRDDKYYVLSNSQDAVTKYFSGTQSNPDFLPKINDHPMGGFVDLQMILKALQTEFSKDSMDKIYYDRNITMWHSLYFTGGEYKDGGMVNTAELNFVDKNTNSLKQLNQYIDDNAKIIIEKKKKQREEWKLDTLPNVKTDTVLIKKKSRSKTKK